MTFVLRDYQQRLVDDVLAFWAAGKRRLLLQLPTGGGKTIVFGAIAKALIAQQQGQAGQQGGDADCQSKILILAHREELLAQAADKVSRFTDLPVGIIKGSRRTNLDAPIQVASVQTLCRCPELLDCVSLIVIDEAHHTSAASYRKILEHHKDAYHLGVTATPVRTDGSGFEDCFEELLCGPTVTQLTDRGYLCPLKLYADPQPMRSIGSTLAAGDFQPSSIMKLNRNRDLTGNIIAMRQRFAKGKRTVVFAINVEHSQEIADRFCQAGIRAEHIDGSKSSGERQRILQDFESGRTEVLCNCNLVSEGFDLPAIEAVQIARPTTSLALWLQQIGRSLRISDNKDCAIAIDHTCNWLVHGLPTQPRFWSLQGVRVEAETETEVLLQCSMCSFIFKRSREASSDRLLRCPSCNSVMWDIGNSSKDDALTRHIRERVKREPVESHASLEMLSPAVLKLASELLHFQELLELQKVYRFGREWVIYRLSLLEPDLAVWEACGREFGLPNAWSKDRYEQQQHFKLAMS